MKKTVVAGFLLVIAIEGYVVLVLPDKAVAGWVAGGSAAILLVSMRWMMGKRKAPGTGAFHSLSFNS